MPFVGYKLQFELNARHHNIKNADAAPHPHTFTISLYLKKTGEEFVLYTDIETDIVNWLRQYQGKDLKSTELFSDGDETLETMGERFYTVLKERVKSEGYELVRLDIYESPVRTYSVSEKPVDSTVNELSAPIPFFGGQAASKTDSARERAPEKETVKPVPHIRETALSGPVRVFAGEVPEEIRVRPKGRFPKLLAALMFLLLCSAGTVCLIKINGLYPGGYDVMYHLYRSDSLLRSIMSGDWYPLYDRFFYNGVQPLRYWPPLPVYVMSLCQYLTGNMLDSYLLYVGLIFFLGGCGWLTFGWKYNRIGASALVGVLWFFAPDNMMVLFGSGNLLRAMVAALLPYFLFFVWRFIDGKKWLSMVPVMLFSSLMLLSHSGETGIVLICLLLFLLIHAAVSRRIREHGFLLLGILLSALAIGLWLYPSVHGGLVSASGSDTQNLQSSFANGWTSLNPLARLSDKDSTYFGLSFFLLSIFGIFLGYKKTFPGFLTGILIYFGTTLSLYPLISKLPMANLLWMTRFITVALAFIFLSFLLWKQLRKAIVLFFCLLIALDSLPSVQYICTTAQARVSDASAVLTRRAEETSLKDAKKITTQRIALMDQSSYGSFAPWYLSGTKPETMCTFGAAWSSAQTAANIVQLNTAFSWGYYGYLFDRCLELGNDTVQIRIALLQHGAADIQKAVEAGKRLGYSLVERTNSNLLFHREINGAFGTKTAYKGIAIGTSSRDIALLYPTFKETTDADLNHYTFDQLRQYSIIYLSGFTYQDREQAEQLLEKLAASGIKVYIDMNRAPTDPSTKTQRFFGVEAQSISFENRFPVLSYAGTDYQLPPFSKEFSKWTTVYLTGLKKIDGYSVVNNKKISFAGTASNPNIHFLGFNLLYFAETGSDRLTVQLLNRFFGLEDGLLPERRIVPLTVSYSPNSIVIKTDEDNVNTALAWHDIFQSDRPLHNDRNLLAVDSGTTVIRFTYPYFREGLAMSIIGLVLSVLYLIFLFRLYKNRPIMIFTAKGKHFSGAVQKKTNRSRGKHYA